MLELIIPQGTPDRQYDIELTQLHPYNIDRINGERPNCLTLKLNGECNSSMSLVEIITYIVIGLIVFSLLAWFIIIRDRVYPKFKRGIIQIQSPYFASERTSGARMVVITPIKKSQGLLDKIFKGKVIYHVNAEWPCDIGIKPSRRDMRLRCPSGQILCSPSPLLERCQSYKLIDASNNNKTIAEIYIS